MGCLAMMFKKKKQKVSLMKTFGCQSEIHSATHSSKHEKRNDIQFFFTFSIFILR